MNDAQIIDQQRQEIADLTAQLQQVKQQVDWFKRQLFGRKSERQIEDNPYQSSLFGKPPIETTEPAQSQPTSTAAPKRRTKLRRAQDVNDQGLRFDASVPQQVIELSAPQLNGEDASDYEVIDYKETVRLAQRPGSYIIKVYRRPVVRRKSTQSLITRPAPEAVLDGCYADVSLLAGLMVDKAVYHLPLYRQHQRLQDAGIRVSRASLLNWMQKGLHLLKPIYHAQWQHILRSQVLAMDEVPIKAGRKSRGKMKTSYFWPIYGEQNEVAFTWSNSRGHQHAVAQLTGFSGTLLTDGYRAYDKTVAKLNKQQAEPIVQANCWAHARRYFERALTSEHDASQQALAQIAQLYEIERHIRAADLAADELLAYRQKHSEPVVQGFIDWLYQQRQRVDLLPSNPLSKALRYTHERLDALKQFLANPHLPIDTNHLERALRVIPMGRKNYLFCWTELGAEQLGWLQSLMVTCRLHDINPYTYLVDVLQRINQHPNTRIEQLTPRLWKQHFADNPLTAGLE